jgi:glutaredoxin
VKEFLSRAGVRYVARNVDEDDAAYRELVAKGWRSVPVTLVGDRAIRGYDPRALREVLDAVALEGDPGKEGL